jgi:hypothetical protein
MPDKSRQWNSSALTRVPRGMPGRRVDHQPRRFVDGDDVRVFVHHAQRDVLGDHLEGRRRGHRHHHARAAADLVGRPSAGRPVDGDRAVLDQRLHARPAEAEAGASQQRVHPHPPDAIVDDQGVLHGAGGLEGRRERLVAVVVVTIQRASRRRGVIARPARVGHQILVLT